MFDLLPVCFYPLKNKEIHGLSEWYQLLSKHGLLYRFVTNLKFLKEFTPNEDFMGQWYYLGAYANDQ